MATLKHYLRLIRFRYHITFLVVIAGAWALAPEPSYISIASLFMAYLCFNVLMYGGLYTLNDIADIKSDSTHPEKKYRPLPSGAISVAKAYVFAFILILAGLSIAYYYFGWPIFLLLLSFIAVNIIYTRLAKKIPYVELLFNSLTYPMRFFLGGLLVFVAAPFSLLLVIFLGAFGVSIMRRVIERRRPGWEARKVLRYYTEKKLIALQLIALVLIVIVALMSWPQHTLIYSVIILLYVVLVFGMYFSKHIINFYTRLF